MTEPQPWDPAGTRPKHDPESLLPTASDPLLPPDAEVVEATVEEDGDRDLLPERRHAAALGDVAPAKHSDYAPRFQFLTGALAAIGVAAIVAIVLFAVVPSTRTPDPPWSSWKPASGGVDGANEIAAHVAPLYKEKGQQLVKVEANELQVNGVPLQIALQAGGEIQIHGEKGVLYQLCGLGSTCAIAEGKPSTERGLLLRREGLELALYTFRYLEDVKQVVIMIPPAKGKAPTVALYFRRGDVSTEIARPLGTSLAPTPPSVDTVKISPDRPLVDSKTGHPWLFSFDGSSINSRAYLVLKPYTPAAEKELQAEIKQRQQQVAATGG